ncbi:MAG TPA: HEAT repeat domain-containing protein [Bacillaceae bacterium]
MNVILWYVLWGIASLQGMAVVYLVTCKILANKRAGKGKAKYEEALPFFLEYFMTGDPSARLAIKELRLGHEVSEKILMDYLKNIRSGDMERVQELAADLLSSKYKKELDSRKWSGRINALYAIEKLKLDSCRGLLLKKLDTGKELLSEENIQTMKALASLNEQCLFDVMLENDMPERVLEELLMRYDLQHMEESIRMAESTDNKTFRRAVLRMIANKGLHAGFMFAEQQLQSPDSETRLRALQAYSSMNYMVDPDKISPFLTSPVWQERMYAARICGKLKLERFKPDLSRLIADRVWWVRYHAGEAISRLKDGDVVLRYLAEEHEDRFARDMARQWAASGGGIE